MQIYVRRGGPNYQKGLAKMRALGQEIGLSIEVFEDHNLMHLHSHVLHILISLCKVDLPFMDTFSLHTLLVGDRNTQLVQDN